MECIILILLEHLFLNVVISGINRRLTPLVCTLSHRILDSQVKFAFHVDNLTVRPIFHQVVISSTVSQIEVDESILQVLMNLTYSLSI